MKKLLTLSLLTALSLGLNATTFAAAAKKEAAATPAPAAKTVAKAAATPAAAPADKAPKALPMYSRIDTLDAAAKTFTTKRRDGVEVKHNVTATTEIKNGEAAATFADLKVGLYVSGLRLKKSETEYDVVKITKIAPPAEKKTKEKKAE